MTLRNMTPVQLPLPPDLLAAIDAYRYAAQIPSRTEAMRQLLRASLALFAEKARGKPVRRKEAA